MCAGCTGESMGHSMIKLCYNDDGLKADTG